MWVSENVKGLFAERLGKAIGIIQDSGIIYEQVGIFGSYARDDYKACSDIDLCIVMKDPISRWDSSILRSNLDCIKVDCTFVTENNFLNSNDKFFINLRRDFRRIL